MSTRGVIKVQNLQGEGKRIVGAVTLPDHRGNLLLSVSTTPNFIELPSEKFTDYLKEEGLNKVVEWRNEHGETMKPGRERYSKFAKSLLVAGSPDDFYKHEIGSPIEIIPEENSSITHSGSQLPVHVLFHRRPAIGVQLEAAWSAAGKGKSTVIGRTDRQGRIRVPLTAPGKWRLHSLMMERCADPSAADWESFWASLTFEIR